MPLRSTIRRMALIATVVPCLLASASSSQDLEIQDGGGERTVLGTVAPDLSRAAPLVNTVEPVDVTPWGDNDFERGVAYNSGVGEYVSLFTLPTDSATVNSVEICFNYSGGGSVNNLSYDILFYRNSGGSPGSLIREIKNLAPTVPLNRSSCLTTSPSGAPGQLPFFIGQKRFFVGIRMNRIQQITVGYDTDGGSSAPSFARTPGGEWEDLREALSTLNTLAYAIDVTLPDENPTGTCPVQSCTTNSNQVCLSDRFQVTADFQDQGGGSGSMKWDDYRANTGIAYFTDPNNAELVVKVLETCPINNHFWVFAGGLTDQEIDLRICDTQTGVEKQYFNPLKNAFLPITDVEAFATCP